MKNLNIRVTNKVAQYQLRDGAIVCGNSDYQITFTFDAEWDAYPTKTARFIWNGKYWDQPFSGNVCKVPIISGADSVSVGVYAGDLCTTTPATIPCKRSILCGTSVIQDEKVKEYRDEAVAAAERAEAATGGLQPNFAESEVWLEEHGDPAKIYVLCDPTSANDGMIFACKKTKLEGGSNNSDNKVPSSIDTDGKPFNNGTGWIGKTRLSSSGGTKPQDYASTTGYISATGGSVIRIKKVPWDEPSMCYVCSYDKDFNFVTAVNSDGVYGGGTVTREGDVAVVTLTDNSNIAYIRVSASHTIDDEGYATVASPSQGPGSYMIVTVNEVVGGSSENTDTIVYEWFNTGHAFVPTDYEDRIIELENRVSDIEEGETEIEGAGAPEFAFTKPTASVDELATLYEEGIRLVAIDNSGNLVPKAISKDGTVFHGCGYVTGYRLNSSGEIVEADFGVLTGFMPYTYGRTITIVGGLSEASTGGQYVATYNSAFELLGVDYISSLISNSGGNAEYDNNGIRTFTVKTANFTSSTNKSMFETASYIRVCLSICVGKKVQVMCI